MTYIHERPDWPKFTWNLDALATLLAEIRHKQGLLLGRMSALGFSLRAEAGMETMALELVKSSAIEGETVDAVEARSSLAKHLGLKLGGLKPVGREVEGLALMTLDATRRYAEPLTRERLWGWQAALFPSGFSGLRKITVGKWRGPEAGPMRVVSGPIGRERVHYEAPAAERLDEEMDRFLAWFNNPPTLDPVLKAGLAHFWFVAIHPFEDGNGRIARAIADRALAQADDCPDRFYGMSASIERERPAYYDILDESQRAGLDITSWLKWFLGCLGGAIDGAEETLATVKRKARVWRKANLHPLNERQRLALARLLDDFVGKLTSGEYAKLAKCSSDTALRDLTELLEYGLLARGGSGGRGVSYALAPEVEREERQ
ncbi:MAG: Fic family protein [Deltaproteobacteria bacterium]|jgi:Fic family protein|nr:Fic family protein [Deltaproteobacteria bacterium]